MDYQKCIKWLEGLSAFPEVTSFDRVNFLLEKFGNPEKKMKFVHVTGTNGKGSTCAMIESIARTDGFHTGLFTSPHLFKYNERIKVDGGNIEDIEFCDLINRVKEAVDEMILMDDKMRPCLFEVVFVMALIHFAEKGVELAVIEVGCGGRRDPSNIIESEVSIITNIDLEHTNILGDTVEKIATDKAGIIKKNSVCITTETANQLINIFAKEAEGKNAKLIVLEPSDIELISQSSKGQVFNFMDYFNLELPLLGDHQLSNAMLAIMCCEVLNTRGFKITEQDIKGGIKNSKWPLRLEIVKSNERTFLIDGAHTEDAVKKVMNTVKNLWQNDKKIAVIGFSEGKSFTKMIDVLINQIDIFILTKANFKGMDPHEIAKYLEETANNQKPGKQIYKTENMNEAIKKALEISQKDDLIMIFGGLYLAAEARVKIA